MNCSVLNYCSIKVSKPVGDAFRLRALSCPTENKDLAFHHVYYSEDPRKEKKSTQTRTRNKHCPQDSTHFLWDSLTHSLNTRQKRTDRHGVGKRADVQKDKERERKRKKVWAQPTQGRSASPAVGTAEVGGRGAEKGEDRQASKERREEAGEEDKERGARSRDPPPPSLLRRG